MRRCAKSLQGSCAIWLGMQGNYVILMIMFSIVGLFFDRNKAHLAHRNKLAWAEMVTSTLAEHNSSNAAKQYALKTLSYMASEVTHKLMIIHYENGRIVKELIRLISDVSSVDKNVKTTATDLFCSLICRATASHLVRDNPGFLVILSSLG